MTFSNKLYSQISDPIQFIKKQNRIRITNAAHIYSSFYWSRITRKPKIAGLPISLSIEPTTACNLRCPECPSGLRSFTRATGNLKQDFFRNLIHDIGDTLQYLIFYFQGEPYIHPHFLEMVQYAAAKNIYTITSTNGHFLDKKTAEDTVKSGLDRIIISVDGTSQETYSAYRKSGSLEKVITGAKNIVEAKKKFKSKTPYTVFQFLVVGPNEHQIPEIYDLADSIGIDEVKLKTAQIYNYKNGHPLIPQNERYARYKKQKDGTYLIKNNLTDHCWKMWHSCVVTWDGQVLPCCFDKDADHSLGDLKQRSFREIWHGKDYQSFREKLFLGRKEIDICTNCTEGCKVWA